MTKRYSISDARANLPSIIDDVIAGNTVELTRRGDPVAVIVSRWLFDRMEPKRSWNEAYREWRASVDLEALAEGPDPWAGIRDASPGRDVDLG